jgi:hypothetical protein
MGLVGSPAAQSFAQAYTIDALTITIPLLVMVVALWFLSENHGLMRCGKYIREKVEPEFTSIIGWEQWLESPDRSDRRSVDKFASGAFFCSLLRLLRRIRLLGGAARSSHRRRRLPGHFDRILRRNRYLVPNLLAKEHSNCNHDCTDVNVAVTDAQAGVAMCTVGSLRLRGSVSRTARVLRTSVTAAYERGSSGKTVTIPAAALRSTPGPREPPRHHAQSRL